MTQSAPSSVSCRPGSRRRGKVRLREGQRHLATWTLQPIAELLAEEATEKLGAAVSIDLMTPLAAFDAGGSARAVATLVQAAAQAKEAGLDPAVVASAFQRMDWEN